MNSIPAASTVAQETSTAAAARWWHGRWGLAGLAAAAYCALFAVWTVTHWGGAEHVTLISDLAQIPMSLFAALACLRTAGARGADRATRRAWRLIGVALLASAAGEALWFNYEILQQSSPFPSWADLGYLSFYPLMLLGLLSLPYAPLNRGEQARLYLDAAVVVAGSGTIIWLLILGPGADTFTPTFEALLATAYPAADLAIVFGLVYFLLRHPRVARRSGFGYLVGAMALFLVADVIFGVQSLQDAYITGGPLDSAWTLSYLLFALAALQQRATLAQQGARFQPARRWRGVWLLPYAALALAGGLVLRHFAGTAMVDPAGFGALIGLFLLAALISVRQALDVRENRRLNEELRLRLRQLDEAGSALDRAQHMAAVGTLAAGVAHEINNPLSVIISHVEALERRMQPGAAPDPEYLRAALGRIERAAWQGARIARGLLTYARGEALALSRVSARELAEEAAALTVLPPEAQIELLVDVAPDAPDVICDRSQMAQVLVNLIDNARDATQGPGQIRLTARRGAGGGLTLQVADDGEGMAPEALQRAFDPFFTTKPVGSGTGLGLSISRGIVLAHEGEIEIDSRPGAGTRVTVRLPLEPGGRAAMR